MKRIRPLLIALLVTGLLPFRSSAQAPAPDASDLSQYATADALWLHIQEVKKGPKTRPASTQEYQDAIMSMLAQLNYGAGEFVKRYPDDPRKWDACLLVIETAGALGGASSSGDEASTVAQLQDLAGRLDAPSSVRGKARYELLRISVGDYMRRDHSTTAADLLAEFKRFSADFPTYPSLDVLKYNMAKSLEASDPAAAGTVLAELAASGQGRIADLARGDLAMREKLKSPLDLRFTAVDGSAVDLSAMRGRVVLVDFWATWCGPCREELPNVVSAYRKLHAKGFEIIGISLDQDRESLVNFTAQNGMPWPQYFDGKGWQNGISSALGIQSIPAMWLVNKKGYVVTTDGRADLEAQVEKLLAE
jgi:thiol-disulfide isomerase/thioredoxin